MSKYFQIVGAKPSQDRGEAAAGWKRSPSAGAVIGLVAAGNVEAAARFAAGFQIAQRAGHPDDLVAFEQAPLL